MKQRLAGAEEAAFVVHAFHSEALDDAKVAANDAGYARFLAALPGGASLEPEYGRLHGPLRVSAVRVSRQFRSSWVWPRPRRVPKL
jgi:hypothetical protein